MTQFPDERAAEMLELFAERLISGIQDLGAAR